MQGLGRFQAEQAAAHHGADTGPIRGGDNLVQVIKGAVNKAVRAVVTVNGRHERIGPGGQHQFVVIQPLSRFGDHYPGVPVDLAHPGGQLQGQPRLCHETLRHQRQSIGIALGKVTGQANPVIGRPALRAQDRHVVVIKTTTVRQRLQKALPHHTVAYQQHLLFRHGNVPFHRFSLPTVEQGESKAHAMCITL